MVLKETDLEFYVTNGILVGKSSRGMFVRRFNFILNPKDLKATIINYSKVIDLNQQLKNLLNPLTIEKFPNHSAGKHLFPP